MEKQPKAIGGEMGGIAFLFRNEMEGNRWELKIDNKLKAYSQGDNEEEHKIGKQKLRLMAIEKGYRVVDGE